MTFAIESRIKSVARTRVTSNSVFSNPRRVRKTAESLPKVDPSPLVLVCMRIMTISSTDSSIWAACRYGAKGYLLPILVIAGVSLPIIAYAGRTGRGWAGDYGRPGAGSQRTRHPGQLALRVEKRGFTRLLGTNYVGCAAHTYSHLDKCHRPN